MNIQTLWQKKGSLIKKLWLNQFAFSLFGLFVASALSGTLCVLAGVFSLLFYLSVVGFAVLDDAQKDRIMAKAGRGSGLSAGTGLAYTALAFAPSVLVVGAYSVYTFFASQTAGVFHTIYFLLVKYVFAGEVLGIDVGLTKYTYDTVQQVRTSTVSPAVLFCSDHAFFQLAFIVISVLVLALVYRLAFTGKISYNTTNTSRKDA